jgi:hypothetical protein
VLRERGSLGHGHRPSRDTNRRTMVLVPVLESCSEGYSVQRGFDHENLCGRSDGGRTSRPSPAVAVRDQAESRRPFGLLMAWYVWVQPLMARVGVAGLSTVVTSRVRGTVAGG